MSGRQSARTHLGRYVVHGEIATGGMASVHYGSLARAHGFSRPVAIKRLHPHLARDPEVARMFIDEARLGSRLHHANVVPVLDVIEAGGELALVMEYVHGETLFTLLQLARARGTRAPVSVATSILAGVLHGLHAAHEARDEHGRPLQLVHRDVSPQNILIGMDGTARLTDFGIAKALGRSRTTHGREIKGKVAYIAPEQLNAGAVDRRADIHAAAVVLWETLVGRPLFDGPNDAAIARAVLEFQVPPPSSDNPDVSPALDAIVLRGLARDVRSRFSDARSMALELERRADVAPQSEVAAFVERLAGARLRGRADAFARLRAGAEVGVDSTCASSVEQPPGTRRIGAAQRSTSRAPTDLGPASTRSRLTRTAEPVADPRTGAERAPLPSAHRQASGQRVRSAWATCAAALALTALLCASLMTGDRDARSVATASSSTAVRATDTPVPRAEAGPARQSPASASDPFAETPPAATSPDSAKRSPLPSEPVRTSRLSQGTRLPTAGEGHLAPSPNARAIQRRAARRDPAPAGRSSPALPASTVARCSPPYALDRDGIRHPKPECL